MRLLPGGHDHDLRRQPARHPGRRGRARCARPARLSMRDLQQDPACGRTAHGTGCSTMTTTTRRTFLTATAATVAGLVVPFRATLRSAQAAGAGQLRNAWLCIDTEG